MRARWSNRTGGPAMPAAVFAAVMLAGDVAQDEALYFLTAGQGQGQGQTPSRRTGAGWRRGLGRRPFTVAASRVSRYSSLLAEFPRKQATRMPDPERTKAVRVAWDALPDAWAAGQRAGVDFYRMAFLGPAQVDACGDVRGLRVLDVGCGTRYFAREMAARGARVTGVDVSARMIQNAQRIEAERPLGIEYAVGDAARLADRFPAGSFDLATSCVALQDMVEPAGALRAVREVLRPGARFVASIVHPFSDTPFRRWERDDAGAKRWLCMDRYFERTTIENTWERWGHAGSTPAAHATLEDWVSWILGAGSS